MYIFLVTCYGDKQINAIEEIIVKAPRSSTVDAFVSLGGLRDYNPEITSVHSRLHPKLLSGGGVEESDVLFVITDEDVEVLRDQDSTRTITDDMIIEGDG